MVDVVVAIHPKYRDVPAVAEVISRFGFLAVHVPALRPDSDSPGLAAILTRRLQRHGIDTPVTELVSGHVISQLEAHYFTSDHDLRAVLDLAATAADAAAREPGATMIEPRHLQPLLDRQG
jgi:hypothetical protein